MRVLLRHILVAPILAIIVLSAAGCGGGNQPASPAGFTPLYTVDPFLGEFYGTVVSNGTVYTVTYTAQNTPQLAEISDYAKGQATILQFPSNYAITGFIAVSTATNRIYGSSSSVIDEFTPTLGYVTEFQEPKNAKYTYSQNIDGLVVDSSGNVYMADGYNIVKFNANGVYLATIPVSDAGLGLADDLAIDSSNNLYVGNINTVTKFSSSGEKLKQFSCSGNASAENSIGVDAAGNIYTASNLDWVGRYSPEGTLTNVSEIGRDISVDAAGNVYCFMDEIAVFHAAKS